jgi:undecaprenyl-diphosphatase
MDYWTVIILGIIQGVTEFLPISSSGHLILAPTVFGFQDQGLAMDVVLHLASLIAIVIFFRKDLLELFKGILQPKQRPEQARLAWGIALATIPGGLVGVLLGKWIENNLRSSTFVACNLLFWSVVFYAADRLARKLPAEEGELNRMSLRQIFFIGCAQAIALLPGTSRSGITIAAGLSIRMSQTASARFSFLLGTPIIFAAGLYKLLSIFRSAGNPIRFSPDELCLGFLVTFISGYLSIRFLMAVVSRTGLLPFIIYRVTLATIILIFY